MSSRSSNYSPEILFGLGVVLSLAAFAGWVTHVVHCLQNGQWGFLIAGALMFPIAVVHGWGLWFGFFL